MSAVKKAIWVIESRFRYELGLDEIAEHSGASRSHLSRSFAMTTGISISAYLRARRLTEAARKLAAGAPDILLVALDAGYGSHEAFTRAFRDQFGVTPEEVRAKGSASDLKLMEPIQMDDLLPPALLEPTFLDSPAMRIAGITQRQSAMTGWSIPAQWQSFTPYIGNFPGQYGKAAYGVVGIAPDDADACVYTAGVEVRSDAEVPPELNIVDVPAHRYARFHHKDHVSTIRSTVHAIFEYWLPTSGYLHTGDLNLIECYGPSFDPASGRGGVEVWFPITR